MITIHLLRHPSEEIPIDGVVLKDTEQYPAVRERISEALKQNQTIELFVLTRVCDDWFWDLSDYRNDVLLINDSLVERLKRKLLIDSLPTDLMSKPEVILGLDLLELPNPAEETTDIWKWITHFKLGELWTAEEPSQEHFSLLVHWYAENTINPLLQYKVDELSKSWIQRATGKLKSAYARFFENPSRNAHLLTIARALLPYGQELREQWLAAEGWYSPKLEDIVDLIKLPNKIPVMLRNKLNPKILTHWNTRLKEL
jgi:hypothetical protein